MRVILLKDVPGQGKRGDIISSRGLRQELPDPPRACQRGVRR
ncbi:MAG: hypothetical protein RJR37_04045 [Peptococcaceae bacterium MAG4]|nr:hypothetical protein [Peptococcaceae bacterium MAG4]